MDRNEVLRRLPEKHALALRLSDQGLDGDQIAERLEIPAEAVGPLLRIAQAKAARLQEDGAGAP